MLSKIRYVLSQIKGMKTNDKIVIIESDDWGAERIPSVKIREKLKKRGLDMDSNPHSRVDTLESELDYLELFDVFQKVNDKYPDKNPILTCNFIMGNPDFHRIRKSNFSEYFFEPFTNTYKEKYGNDNALNLLKEGIAKGFIYPQFHGRDHLNIHFWMQQLNESQSDYRIAFPFDTYSIDSIKLKRINSIMASYDYTNPSQKSDILNSISEGVDLFANIFGFNSVSTVPPRYLWDLEVEKEFVKKNVKVFQTAITQQLPKLYHNKKIKHFTGKKSSTSIIYSVRNAHFEPSYDLNYNWINQVMEKAKIAFFLRTPLIISTHRLNFVGGINEKNRKDNLAFLYELLIAIIIKYPSVKFSTTSKIFKEGKI